MRDKIYQAFQQIGNHREEIKDIYPSGSEYYFVFRGRAFSVSQNSSGGIFYIYPKYIGQAQELANLMEHGIEHPNLTFITVADEEIGGTAIEQFHGWIQSKFLGLDDVLRDIGL